MIIDENTKTVEIDGVVLNLSKDEEIESLSEFDGNFKKERADKGE